MKRIFLIAFTVFLNVMLFSSCSEDDILNEELFNQTEACCGAGEDPPPPPPPPCEIDPSQCG